MSTPCKVAIVGFGTVGRSVARILCSPTSTPFQLTHIFNRRIDRKKVEWVPPDVVWTEDFDAVLESDAEIIVELIGGLHPAEELVRGALEAGKSVVTANKQLIAHSGPELFELARRVGRQIGCEASVAGGIPVVAGVQEGLAGDRLFRVAGVLNGTCNYILTRMESANIDFATALREAQELGFAEADPTDDVDGFDARAKLTILARVGLRCQVKPADISCTSIREVSALDFAYAHHMNCTIRQVSRAERVQDPADTLYASVQPALVPRASPLASVQGGQNLVVTSGQYGGDTVFSGHGAGGDPTAVAVVSDLIAIAQNRKDSGGWSQPAVKRFDSVSADFTSPHYVRFTVRDRPGIIAALAGVFSDHDINIDAILQEPGGTKAALPFVITLEECRTAVLDRALKDIAALDFHVHRPLNLPILDGGPTPGATRTTER